jgi:hypothetical protein
MLAKVDSVDMVLASNVMNGLENDMSCTLLGSMSPFRQTVASKFPRFARLVG